MDTSLMDNSSPAIGGLVIWLLPIGGLLSVFVANWVDKQAKATRTVVRR